MKITSRIKLAFRSFSNFNKPYAKPDFLDDNYDHLSKLGGAKTPA
jgi:hypothetical protein